MRERPMLFNGPMVRAILDGRKTQTRRAMKNQPQPVVVPGLGPLLAIDQPRGPNRWLWPNARDEVIASCPFGKPGDRLWVREAHAIFQTHGQHRADGQRWGPWGGLPTTLSEDGKQIAYYRDGFDRCDPGRWRPSIHMPRWACRLVLEITGVRVDRLQAISEADALAEGVDASSVESFTRAGVERPAGFAFRDLWTSTGGDWDSNPWVWAIDFRRVTP